MIQYNPVELLSKFHKAFNYNQSEKPTVLTADEVFKRIVFIQEELIELLAATTDSPESFFNYLTRMSEEKQKAIKKELKNVGEKDELERIIAQSDALVDILVFTYGTSDISGVDVRPLMEIVMESNMSKLDENGKPIYNEIGKIQKSKLFVEPEPKIEEEIKRQLEQ